MLRSRPIILLIAAASLGGMIALGLLLRRVDPARQEPALGAGALTALGADPAHAATLLAPVEPSRAAHVESADIPVSKAADEPAQLSEAAWQAVFDSLTPGEQVSRVAEIRAEYSKAVEQAVSTRLNAGQYVVRPVTSSNSAAPESTVGIVALGGAVVEGKGGMVHHHVELLEADYPELAALKRRIEWAQRALQKR
jgi:hypothetical protein